MKIDLERLCRRIHYQFKDLQYLIQALTHRSASVNHYERFEFLGDSILSFTITNELFKLFPHQTEGQLSRLRSFLVKEDTLAEIAKEIDLGNFLFLGPGELKTGGFRRNSTLADSLEALFAAVYLDGGVEASVIPS
jgi:ribonuclease-3